VFVNSPNFGQVAVILTEAVMESLISSCESRDNILRYFLNVVILFCWSVIKVYNYQSTQSFIVNYSCYSDMFRLNRVMIRLS